MPTMMPNVSVVIPNYQGENFIAPCLQSLLEQKDAAMVIRIIENGSKDMSRGRIYSFLKENGYLTEKGCKVPEVKVHTNNNRLKICPEINELPESAKADESEWERYTAPQGMPDIEVLMLSENTGFCHAVNEGIERSKEEYLFLLNNDTTLEPDCVKELVTFMEEHADAFSAGAKMVAMKEPEIADDCGDYFNALGYAYAAGKGKNSARYQNIRAVFSACAGAAIYRRSHFDEIGLFDENHFAYLEDVDIGYRARIYGYRNYFVPTAVVYHAGSAVSGSRHNEFKVKLSSKNSVYLVYKNQPLLQWIINLPLLFVGYLVKSLFFMRKGLGKTYIKGLGKGITFCFSKEARAHKVRFRCRNVCHYLKIQLELWANIFRMFAITK